MLQCTFEYDIIFGKNDNLQSLIKTGNILRTFCILKSKEISSRLSNKLQTMKFSHLLEYVLVRRINNRIVLFKYIISVNFTIFLYFIS